MTTDKKNRSTSNLPGHIVRVSGKRPVYKSKSIVLWLTICLSFLLLVSSLVFCFLYINEKGQNDVQRGHIAALKNKNQELIAEIKSFLCAESQRLSLIEAILNKDNFKELYRMSLFYYNTEQYEIALPLIEHGIKHYKNEHNQSFQLLKWLVDNRLGKKKSAKEAYIIARNNPNDLELLLLYAIRNSEYTLQKNIYKTLKKSR